MEHFNRWSIYLVFESWNSLFALLKYYPRFGYALVSIARSICVSEMKTMGKVYVRSVWL